MAKIGFFDSGFGGLTVLKSVVADMPEYDYIYLADSARVPYGNRSQETIYNFTLEAINFLFKNDCELVVLACNTVSAEALRRIQREFLKDQHAEKKVLGVIIPAAEEAVEVTRNNRIGVIATESTVTSNVFEREVCKINTEVKVFQQGCPLLVPIVEANEIGGEVSKTMLKKYLAPLLAQEIDTLVLGCTHYGLLETEINAIIGPNISVINESVVVSKKLQEYLNRHPEVTEKLSRSRSVKFYCTDSPDKFEALGGQFYASKIQVKKVCLEN